MQLWSDHLEFRPAHRGHLGVRNLLTGEKVELPLDRLASPFPPANPDDQGFTLDPRFARAQALRSWDPSLPPDQQPVLAADVHRRAQGVENALFLGDPDLMALLCPGSAVIETDPARRDILERFEVKVHSPKRPPHGPFQWVIARAGSQLESLRYLLSMALDYLGPDGRVLLSLCLPDYPAAAERLIRRHFTILERRPERIPCKPYLTIETLVLALGSSPDEAAPEADLYDQAGYFETVYRHYFQPELVDFILDGCTRFHTVPTNGLEMCCGNGLLSLALGKRGLNMRAVDLAVSMVERLRPHLSAEVGDMTGYVSPQPVDFVTNLGDNFCYLLESDQLLACLRATRQSLVPGGLFFCELNRVYLIPHQGVTRVDPPFLVYSYAPGQRRSLVHHGASRIQIDWLSTEVRVDPARQTYQLEVVMTVSEPGTRREFRSPEHGRFWYPKEFEALARVAGLEPLGWYSAPRLTAHLEDDPTAILIYAIFQAR